MKEMIDLAFPAAAPPAEQPSDEEIVARVLGGEKALFEILVRRYNQRLYRVARRHPG